MKQIVLKTIAPNIPVLDVVCGSITDGHFVAAPDVEVWLNSNGFSSCGIVFSSLLGGEAYIKNCDLMTFIRTNIELLCDTIMYPNFLVFTLKSNENEKSEEIEA